jgi:ABC-type sugar transport system ATPase subunit
MAMLNIEAKSLDADARTSSGENQQRCKSLRWLVLLLAVAINDSEPKEGTS